MFKFLLIRNVIEGGVDGSMQENDAAESDLDGNEDTLPDPLDLTSPPSTNFAERLRSDNSGPNSQCFSAWNQRSSTSGLGSGSHQNPLVN
jgi:hypothetical protein